MKLIYKSVIRKFHLTIKVLSVLILLAVSVSVKGAGFEKDGIFYNIISTQTEEKVEVIPGSVKYSGDVVIPAIINYDDTDFEVTHIAASAFRDCEDMTSVTIGESVEWISSFAFSGCTGLTEVTIPNAVISIGSNAFKDCSNLASIIIGNSVLYIDNQAFYFCTSLKSVTIGDSLKNIYYNAFSGCKDLESFYVSEGNNNFSSLDGVLFNKDKSLLIRYPLGKKGDYTIPDFVTSVGESAFDSSNSLTTVTIPGTVTLIGFYAFSDCKNLTAFYVDEGNADYTSLDGVLFSKDKSLLINYPAAKKGDYIIPDFVTRIETWAFGKCNNINKITIPNSVSSIGFSAFSECKGLKSVTIPNSVAIIDKNAFHYCTALASVEIPNSVTLIDAYAFSLCEALTSITIPNSVTNIEAAAFSSCSSLNMLRIGNSVNYIDRRAFYNCEGLCSISCEALVPPAVSVLFSDVFSETTYSSAILYVPDTSVSDYASADDWKNFKNIRPLSESSVNSDMVQLINCYASGNTVTIENAVGQAVNISAMSGTRIKNFTVADSVERIELSGGVYIVTLNGTSYKVAVM